jgi:hypothetical protein
MGFIILIEVRLKDEYFYKSINEKNSLLFYLILGTVQGYILVPILYSFYVSAVFELIKMSTFVDDDFTVCWNRNKELLMSDMEKG